MSASLKLIVGLGNPEAAQLATRHNVGFWFIDTLAHKLKLTFAADKKFQAELCRYQNGDIDCWLCKPITYMNNSGNAVIALSNYYKIPIEKMLIVHDDIDLNVGAIRFKHGGGHGGNNGLRDIIQKIGGGNFNRLRIGVGHPGSADKVTPHVLSKPSRIDEDTIRQGITKITDNHETLFAQAIEKLMNQFNSKGGD